MPMWKQLTICSAVLLLAIYIGVTMIGKEEYNKVFCEEKLGELLPNEKAALWEDQRTKTLDDIAEGKRKWGCCRVPDGAEKISKSKNCIYVSDYEEPRLKQKISYFLKKFI